MIPTDYFTVTSSNYYDGDKYSKMKKNKSHKKGITVFVLFFIVALFVIIYSNMNSEDYPQPPLENPIENNYNYNNNNNNYDYNIPYSNDNTTKQENEDCNVAGFTYLDPNNPKGPITTNREKDMRDKTNLFNMVREEDDSFFYDQERFNNLPEVIPMNPKYICERSMYFTHEGQKSEALVCPQHYTIKIDGSYYGRRPNDHMYCTTDENNKTYDSQFLKVSDNNCSIDATSEVKNQCEGKLYCELRPGNYMFDDVCINHFKLLHVNYHCEKDKEIKKPRIKIVMYSDRVKPNSIDENAVSEFYQYAQIYGYGFEFYNKKFDTERSSHFMKLNAMTDSMFRALKEENYDWLFWVDSDVVITNPNIRLEAFLPNENMSRVNFIVSDDHNGLSSGSYFLKVHSWSLNYLMRAISYPYHNINHLIYNYDQSALNNVLLESNDESEHYIVVPQKFFNSYPEGERTIGSFLVHFSGFSNKDVEASNLRYFVQQDKSWQSKTNMEVRQEVLEYYNLPKSQQHQLKVENKPQYMM